jgi:predicted nucleic acid-binding protein
VWVTKAQTDVLQLDMEVRISSVVAEPPEPQSATGMLRHAVCARNEALRNDDATRRGVAPRRVFSVSTNASCGRGYGSEWLIDKSALVRLAYSPDRDLWANRVERGLVHISNMTRLEIGYSAQSGDVARREFGGPPLAAMPVEYLTPRIEGRALEVQMLLADRGQHRGPSIPDLIIAACAELSGLAILHVDKDFDTITAITGQPTTRLDYTSTNPE